MRVKVKSVEQIEAEHGVEQAAFEAYIGGKLARELKAADMNILQAVIN